MNLDPGQLAAVENSLKPASRFSVITGPAGTGKTTIIKNILDRMDGQAVLLAPTGKAAARLREATGYHASTVHRFLLWDGTRARIMDPVGVPIIVDEASMLDGWLAAQTIKWGAGKVIWVGDAAQLPPVGKGSPFHDVVSLRPGLVSHLDICHRAKAAVHHAATCVREGRMPPPQLKSEGEAFRMMETGGPEATEELICEWAKRGFLDPERDAVITCRNGEHEEDWGSVATLNLRLVDIFNPRGVDLLGNAEDVKWQTGDRVMNLKNNSELDWWNGDTGKIEDVDSRGNLWVQPDREGATKIMLEREYRQAGKTLNLAYALTVHKSQGSQYRRVVFAVYERHARLLTRNLIYTAITRAREGVLVVGQLRAFRAGLMRVAHKATVLQQLLRRAA